MKPNFLFILLLLSAPYFSFAQSLTNYYQFPSYNPYNYFWGITSVGNDLWVATDYDGINYPFCMMYKISKTGAVLDSVVSPFKFNHGLSWDGQNFWWAEDFRTAGARVFKISSTGVKLDSIALPSLIGGITGGIGDIEIRGNKLWFAVYYPDFTTYPNSYAYVMDLTTRVITDTIPLRGRQIQGITVKGDTVFYVNDNFQDVERIYAYRKASGSDTLFSFAVPDPDIDCNPKGLHWDGESLWLLADRVGGNAYIYKALYRYDLNTKGWPVISNPSTLPFGDVTVGVPQNQNLIITNTGSANLAVDSIKISNSLFSYTPTNTPHNITPGQSKTYSVNFNPVGFGDQVGVFTIYCNDPVQRIKTVQLTGRGVYGSTFIRFSANNLDFGGKRKNSTSYISLKIFNDGTQNLIVDSLKINNQSFFLRDYTLPMTISYTDSASIKVWYKPSEWLNYKDTIKIYSNATNGILKKVPVQGSVVPYDSSLGGIIWSGNVPDNPNTSADDLTARYAKRIKDLNGDGIDDILITTDNYYVLAYNGNSSGSADILWAYNLAPNNYNTGNVDYNQGLQIIDDISGDGVNDVVIGTGGGSESVIAINGVTGNKIWEFGDSLNYNNGDVWAIDVKRDWNNDGKKDVLASVSGNESSGLGRFSVFLLHGTNGSVIWQINQAADRKMKYAIVSTDDGGAVGSRVASGSVAEVIGFNKLAQFIWTYNTTYGPFAMIEIPNIGGSSTSDIVVGEYTGKVTALAGNNGQVMWQQSTLGNILIEDIFLVPDVNGSGYPDILVSALTPFVYLLEGSTGAIIWQAQTAGNTLGAGVLGDLTGDLKPEVASADLGNMIKIYNGTSGVVLFTYPFGSGGNSTAAECVWQADDLDRNGTLEFIAGSRDGRIVMFSGGLGVTVPVELVSFSATAKGNSVNLFWKTGSELNNKEFLIGRKKEHESNFIDIAIIPGNGTTNEKNNYFYTDNGLTKGKYTYRLQQIDFDGSLNNTKTLEIDLTQQIEYELGQNYPNPFNPVTKLNYSTREKGNVKLILFDILGNSVKTLVNEVQDPGTYEIELNAGNLASGIYFYRLEAGNYVAVKKLTVLK